MSRQACRLAVTGIVIATVAYGCGAAARVERVTGMEALPRQAADVLVPLKAPIEVPDARSGPRVIISTLAFRLQQVPNPARLEMLVTGITSACPLDGYPQGATSLIVNGRDVSVFTLGPSGVGHTSRVTADLDPAVLKIGDNSLTVKGLPCTLGNFEVVRISDVVVRTGR